MMSYEPILTNVDPTLRQSIKIAVELGAMVRRKEITREENDQYMVQLMAYDKGAECPGWLLTLFGKKEAT